MLLSLYYPLSFISQGCTPIRGELAVSSCYEIERLSVQLTVRSLRAGQALRHSSVS